MCKEECWGSWNSRTRLAAPNWPPGAIPVMRGALIHEKRCFSYFSRNRNRPAVVESRQAPPSSLLGARRQLFFLVCAVFVKLHFLVR